MEKAFSQFSNEANNCNTVDAAISIYTRAKAILGTSTRLELMKDEIRVVLDGMLSGSYSNKAILQSVLVDKKPFVFKYPTRPEFASSICRDYEFCEQLKDANSGILPTGIVDYQRLKIVQIDGNEVIGSISKFYCFSLNQLTRPLPLWYVLDIGKRIVTTLDKIHTLQYVVNDIKPENLYMDTDGNVDIADFGGATANGDKLVEITTEYYPNDLSDDRFAYYTGDWFCLINTVLDLLGQHKICSTTKIRSFLTEAIKGYSEEAEFWRLISSKLNANVGD